MVTDPSAGTATVLPFEIADRANPVGSEQLEAADVTPRQYDDRVRRRRLR